MGRLKRNIPDWIKFTVPGGPAYAEVKRIIKGLDLHTICTEARCPNIGECLCDGTATFLLMGKTCTRNCLYCAVEKGIPGPLDAGEPVRIGQAVAMMKLRYTVLTSVTRDDLPDGGASVFAAAIDEIRVANPGVKIEVLVPDFLHSRPGSLDLVLSKKPDVFNHNIETARSRYRELRPMGDYVHSLDVIRKASAEGIHAKSGLMIGFGETADDIIETLEDLRDAGCSLLTVGQYLRSQREGYPVEKYYSPEEFDEIGQRARGMGFADVQCGPLVRSSYRAARAAVFL
jgi:lipoic acid synthetase